MILSKLYLYIVLSFFHTVHTNTKEIVVVGEAYNEKDGAWVFTNSQNYFLDGVEEWDERVEGKKVKVWGKLLIEKLNNTPQVSSKPGVPPPPIPQQIAGVEKQIILKAKWKLLR